MSDAFALSFTTSLKPAKKFLVDGAPYEILGVDHLSPDDETEVTALFARYNVLQSELEVTSNVAKGKGLAEKIKTTRLTILTKLTSMPRDVAGTLLLTQQVALLDTLASDAEGDDAAGTGTTGDEASTD